MSNSPAACLVLGLLAVNTRRLHCRPPCLPPSAAHASFIQPVSTNLPCFDSSNPVHARLCLQQLASALDQRSGRLSGNLNRHRARAAKLHHYTSLGQIHPFTSPHHRQQKARGLSKPPATLLCPTQPHLSLPTYLNHSDRAAPILIKPPNRTCRYPQEHELAEFGSPHP